MLFTLLLVLITQVGTNSSAFAWFSDISRRIWALYPYRGVHTEDYNMLILIVIGSLLMFLL